jgi:hypothetical protein
MSTTIVPDSTSDRISCAVVVERDDDGGVLLLLKGAQTSRALLSPGEVTQLIKALQSPDDGAADQSR